MMKIRLVFPVFLAGILLVILLFSLQSTTSYASYSNFAPNILTTDLGNQTSVISPVVILIDDFVPQPNENQSDYIFNRLEGNRGLLNDAIVTWGQGKVTSTITDSTVWGGIWLSLNHRDFEKQPFNFSAILPAPISSAFQSKITTLTVEVAGGTAGTNLKLELKNDLIQWVMPTYTLSGGQETISYHLNLSDDIYQLALVHDKVVPGDFVTIENLSFEATTQITDTAQAAFVWSYGMLLNNWNPTTGLIRDSAKLESGIFDGIQSTGSLAAATAMAYQLGVVNQADAIEIISKISNTLLLDIPRYHGLWPHWVISSTGAFTIVNNTEWSSVDTVIAAIALLDAQVALNLDTISTTQLLQGINWDDLKQPNGISHGYKYDGSLITSSWDTFGGESWLVALAYAAAKHEVPPLKYPLPPTANGSGFIDELAWLLVMPPSVNDVWGVDWSDYRTTATLTQTMYYTTNYPSHPCYSQLGLFGLSAGEVPIPSIVSETQIYQAFGVGGQFSPPHDGSTIPFNPVPPVVVPHYSAMIASLRPTESISMWTWLINEGAFSPLNNVESLSFPSGSSCDASEAQWNQLKGSWNLALQTLGWGRYLAERQGQVPTLWQATLNNEFLHDGYSLLVPSRNFLPLILKNYGD